MRNFTDMKEVKALTPIVHTLRDDRLKLRGMIVTLTALGAGGAWLLAKLADKVLATVHLAF